MHPPTRKLAHTQCDVCGRHERTSSGHCLASLPANRIAGHRVPNNMYLYPIESISNQYVYLPIESPVTVSAPILPSPSPHARPRTPLPSCALAPAGKTIQVRPRRTRSSLAFFASCTTRCAPYRTSDPSPRSARGPLQNPPALSPLLQVTAYLAGLHHSGLYRPSLVVCPATVLRQWMGELRAWWPALRWGGGAARGGGQWERET